MMPGVKGRSGRRPKPTVLKLVHGARAPRVGHKPIKNEPQPPVAAKIPSPPKGFYPGKDADEHTKLYWQEARDYWNNKGKVLHAMGLLTTADMTIFECMAVSWADWRHAVRQKGYGYFVADTTNPLPTEIGQPQKYGSMKNPYFVLEREALKKLKSLEIEFGLTPASRAKVGASAPAAGQPAAGAGGGAWGGLMPLPQVR